jgi:hypothetical protein
VAGAASRSDPRASRFGACDRRAVTGDRRSQVRGVGRSLDDGIGPARRSIERESVVSVSGSEGNPDGDRTRACSRCAAVNPTAAAVYSLVNTRRRAVADTDISQQKSSGTAARKPA